ncbi:MAG: hypothetical protein ABI382_02160 [Nakamurella sp.]
MTARIFTDQQPASEAQEPEIGSGRSDVEITSTGNCLAVLLLAYGVMRWAKPPIRTWGTMRVQGFVCDRP